jgi:hypothetical protein
MIRGVQIRAHRRATALAAGLTALALGLGLAACSAIQSARSRTDRAVALMNREDYADALALLEPEHAAHPSDNHVTVLLAQAHLGAARLEMLELADHVMSGRFTGGEVELSMHADCPTGPIRSVRESDARCIFFRILRELPPADDPHVLRARDLLRAAYPDAPHTPTDINFLAAFVELSSALSRVKAFLLQGAFDQPTEAKFTFVIHNAKILLDELQQGLKRARYSYGKVSRFVATLGHQKLVFSEDIGVPALLRFGADVLRESKEEIDSQLNGAFAGALGNVGSGFVEVLRSLDVAQFAGSGEGSLQTAFMFESAINTLLKAVADNMESASPVNVFEVAWSNPPRIFSHLSEAATRTWESESPAPLKEYLAATQSDWDELERLRYGWENWVNAELTPDQRDGLLSYLRMRHQLDPRLSGLPAQLTSENLRRWQTGFTAALEDALLAVLDGTDPFVPKLDPGQTADGRALLQASLDWINRNLWVSQ